jgi:hypothetical protein
MVVAKRLARVDGREDHVELAVVVDILDHDAAGGPVAPSPSPLRRRRSGPDSRPT